MFLQDFLTLPNAVQPVALALVSQRVHFFKKRRYKASPKEEIKIKLF